MGLSSDRPTDKVEVDQYVTRFDDCGTNNRDRNKLWEELGAELGFDLRANIISKKYRYLYSTYNTKKAIENRSGEGSVKWQYLKVFDSYTGGNIEENSPGNIEIGGCLPHTLLDIIEDSNGDLKESNFDSIHLCDDVDNMPLLRVCNNDDVIMPPKRIKKVGVKKAGDKFKALQIEALEVWVEILKSDNKKRASELDVDEKIERSKNELTDQIKEVEQNVKTQLSEMFEFIKEKFNK